MKHLKRILRLCGLVLFLVLAVAGIGIFGMAPALSKDRKLFADRESSMETIEENTAETPEEEKLR